MGTSRAEWIFYHAFDATGLLEISVTSSSGPWTPIRLTSPKRLTEALEEWTDLANAALPSVTWLFTNDEYDVLLEADDEAWVKLGSTMRELLGFTTEIVDANGPNQSDATVLAMLETNDDFRFAAGATLPMDKEESDLYEYRGARASSYHYGRALEVMVDLCGSAAALEAWRRSPIFGGHGAFWVAPDQDNVDPFSGGDPAADDNLEGALTVYPIETVRIEQDSPDDVWSKRFRCTMADPGATLPTPPATTDPLWKRMCGALPYGYTLFFVRRIEGIPTLFVEVLADMVAPEGYDLDASLVIDRSSALGSVVVQGKAIANGFDAETRLMDTTIVRVYTRTPERLTELTQQLDHDDTIARVEDARDFSGLTEFYIGTSCIFFENLASDQHFGSLHRDGMYGPNKTYPIGTLVTDGPLDWVDRQDDIFAVILDPMGRYVQGGDILDGSAVMRWSGRIASEPERAGNEWVMHSRDQVRLLAEKLGVAASGTAVWSEEDDALVTVPTAMRIRLKAALSPSTGIVLDVQVRPFTAYSPGDQARMSELRDVITTALTAAATGAAEVNGFKWVKVPRPDLGIGRSLWVLMIDVDPDVLDTHFRLMERQLSHANGVFKLFLTLGSDNDPVTGSASSEMRHLEICQPTIATAVSLGVILDEGDPAELPTIGAVALEAAGKVDYAKYTALTLDPVDPSKVHLQLAEPDRVTGDELQAVLAGERNDVSVRFLWSDSGGIADILRRAIVSTGDGIHGAYDTLPRGQGLGLPYLDADSFDEVLGGLFADLTFQIFVDAGTTLEEVFGGILRLARAALVARVSDDGSECQIACVDVGVPDTAVPAARITDDALVVVNGKRPVERKSLREAPAVIECKVRSIPVNDMPAAESAITFKHPQRKKTGGTWELQIYGLTRAQVASAGLGWARAIFLGAHHRQVLRLTVPPFYDAAPGAVVFLALEDPHLWQYDEGTPGYTGLARVVGDPIQLATNVLMLDVECDGVLGPGPLCPAIPIEAVNGGATTPTSIDIDISDADLKVYELLVAAKDGQSTWYLEAFEQGQDIPYRYTLSTITLPGGDLARLTVTAYPTSPSVSLDTGFLLTWPISSLSTENQNRYLHTDQKRRWS